MADGRDLEHAEPARLEVGAHELGEILRLWHIDLVECDELRALEQRHLALGHGIRSELGEDDVKVGERVAPAFERGAVQHVHERRAALDVAEELETESSAFARALDEAGHVGHGVAHVTGLHDPEVGVQGRERVFGDLGARGRDRGDEARLSCRREADERDVGDGLQFELDVAFPPRRAEQGEAGGLALGVRKGRVAEPTDAAGRDDEAHARLDHVDEGLAGCVLHHGSDGDQQFEVLAHGARAVIAHAEPAVAGGAVGRVVVRQQRRHLGVGDQHDVATVTAVAAVRAGERLELLALHRDAAVAALAGAQVQRHAIDECDHALPLGELRLCLSRERGRAEARPLSPRVSVRAITPPPPRC